MDAYYRSLHADAILNSEEIQPENYYQPTANKLNCIYSYQYQCFPT